MSKAMLNIDGRTVRRRMENGETLEEVMNSYPKLTDTQKRMITDAL